MNRRVNRRGFLRSLAAVSAGTLLRPPAMHAALPKMKITRVRAYAPPAPNPLFNQADTVITIETDAGNNVVSYTDLAGNTTSSMYNDTGGNDLDELCWSAAP